jgi:hypothetical protein
MVNYQRQWEGVATCLAHHWRETRFEHFRPRFENGRMKTIANALQKMKWVRYDQASDPVFENHNCQCLLESFNVSVLLKLKLRIKFVKAGLSVERVTDDLKPFWIQDFYDLLKLLHGLIIPFPIRHFDDMTHIPWVWVSMVGDDKRAIMKMLHPNAGK